ncbi:MAG: hypothetical protein AMXMBFR78_01280 [Rubrivivax sp.]
MKAAGWERAWLQETSFRLQEPEVWRGVESQYANASLDLVDSYREHDVLERLLEESKPPLPDCGRGKHFLLCTPFRYTPQRPSRFRSLGHRGIWYGARQPRTACAEIAYWRKRFILDSAGLTNSRIKSSHTLFAASIDGLGIDLTSPPWVAFEACWTSSEDYTQTHGLAAAAEDAGLQVIMYASARAPGGTCFAVLSVEALGEPKGGIDRTRQNWICIATRDRVEMIQKDGPGRFSSDD